MERLILRGAQLIDGTGAEPARGQAVVVEEGRRLAPGLAADLIAVAGAPAARIQALEAVRLVLVNGKPVVDRVQNLRVP